MKKMLIAALALVALVGALGAVAVSAQSGGTSSITPADTLISKVAQKLGISEDQLKTAFKDSEKEMVDNAVNNGKLTDTQGDKIKARIDAAPGLGLGIPHFLRDRVMRFARYEVVDAAAQALNVDKQALVEQLRGGQSLLQVAQGKGVSEAEFKADLLANVKSDLDAKVQSNNLTHDQADKIYQAIQNHIDDIVNATPPAHPGPGGLRGQMKTSSTLNS